MISKLLRSAKLRSSPQFMTPPGRPVASRNERTWWYDSSTPSEMRSAVAMLPGLQRRFAGEIQTVPGN